MMSWVAINLVSWLVKGPFNDLSTVPAQTTLIPMADRLLHIPYTRIHIGLILGLIGILAVIGFWWLHYRARDRLATLEEGAEST